MRIAGGFDSLPANQFVAGTVLTSTSPAYARFSEIGKIEYISSIGWPPELTLWGPSF